MRATGAVAETGRLPQDISGWDQYDVVILGDLAPKYLNGATQDSLDEFVRVRGGQLVVISGRDHMPRQFASQPFMDLLPVEKAGRLTSAHRLQVALTAAGRTHEALTLADTEQRSERVWQQQFDYLPLHTVSEYSRPKTTAESLIAIESADTSASAQSDLSRAPEHALLCWHQVGAGRVVYLSSPSTYHLRFRRGDRYHHRFWGQLLRWLTAADRSMGTQTVRISTDRVRYQHGDEVDVTLKLTENDGRPVAGATVGVIASPETGSDVSIELTADDNVPGRYLGSLAGLGAGPWRITPTGNEIDRLLPRSGQKLQTESRITIAEADSPELLNTRCNITLLEQIAEVTGGQVLPPTAIDEVLHLTALEQQVTERVERQALWNRWSLLAIAFGCLCTEWVVRRRLGLV